MGVFSEGDWNQRWIIKKKFGSISEANCFYKKNPPKSQKNLQKNKQNLMLITLL